MGYLYRTTRRIVTFVFLVEYPHIGMFMFHVEYIRWDDVTSTERAC